MPIGSPELRPLSNTQNILDYLRGLGIDIESGFDIRPIDVFDKIMISIELGDSNMSKPITEIIEQWREIAAQLSVYSRNLSSQQNYDQSHVENVKSLISLIYNHITYIHRKLNDSRGPTIKPFSLM